jgi:RNA recognition motif-containing protein
MNLIVRNVDPECTKEEFESLFRNFGEIRSIKLVPEANVGFVCFLDRESARNAKENNNLVLRDRKLSVYFCEPKESRQKQLEELWDRRVYEK